MSPLLPPLTRKFIQEQCMVDDLCYFCYEETTIENIILHLGNCMAGRKQELANHLMVRRYHLRHVIDLTDEEVVQALEIERELNEGIIDLSKE